MKINSNRIAIMIGLLDIALVIINWTYLLGYVTKITSLSNGVFMSISDIIIFFNFDTIRKYEKSKENTIEAIHWI